MVRFQCDGKIKKNENFLSNFFAKFLARVI